jgi:hypothetical protein
MPGDEQAQLDNACRIWVTSTLALNSRLAPAMAGRFGKYVT